MFKIFVILSIDSIICCFQKYDIKIKHPNFDETDTEEKREF